MEARDQREAQATPAWSVPTKGDRVERLQPATGIRTQGTVQYVDDLQILVKWDDGRSESLRPGADAFRIRPRA
jgi:uncharacterized protein DUF4314